MHEDQPNSSFDAFAAEMDLLLGLPTAAELSSEPITPSAEAILAISERGIGLRTTLVGNVEQEVSAGTHGDFLVISNLAELLSIPQELMEVFKASTRGVAERFSEEDLKRFALSWLLANRKTELLAYNKDFVQKFVAGIKKHIADAILRNLTGYFHATDTVAHFFEAETVAHFPGIVLIEKNSPHLSARDVAEYHPFGKFGSHDIMPEEILVGFTIDEHGSELAELQHRYQAMMGTPLSSPGKNGKDMLSQLNGDLLDIYVQKIFKALQ